MNLSQLIERLKAADQSRIVLMGFSSPHSYRGYYEELAFEPTANTSIADMLKCAEESLGRVFQGYKGGDYRMHAYTEVWLANYGDTGEGIGPVLLDYMLGTLFSLSHLVTSSFQRQSTHRMGR